jgi:hypothetical protein
MKKMLVKLTQCKDFFFVLFFLLFLILTYSQTCVQGPPQIKWPLLTGGRCSKVNYELKLYLRHGGRCGQVVTIWRWSFLRFTYLLPIEYNLLVLFLGRP